MQRVTLRCIGWIFFVFAALLAFYFCIFRDIAWTDDAYVHGNPVYLTPLHSGFVTAIHTDDTFFVEKNQVLVELDKTDAKIALDRSKEALAETTRSVCQMYHEVFALRSEIESIKALFIRNAQDFEHRLKVLSAQAVSLEDYEHAVASLREAFFQLKKSEALYEKALSQVQGVSIISHPLIQKAKDAVRDAWVYLRRCDLYAPTAGIAAQRLIQVGMWTPAGEPLMSVVPMDQIWINANFKETQLKRMRIGQRARIRVDLYGSDAIFYGKVVGLPAVAGNVTSLLPPQNLSGNWIKIVQRLPVRIELEPGQIEKHPLRLGLSCEVTVHLDDQSGGYLPTSPKGSPTYATDIYEQEEEGDLAYIQKIIDENLDPQLKDYFHAHLDIKPFSISIPDLICEAISTSSLKPFEPPFPQGIEP